MHVFPIKTLSLLHTYIQQLKTLLEAYKQTHSVINHYTHCVKFWYTTIDDYNYAYIFHSEEGSSCDVAVTPSLVLGAHSLQLKTNKHMYIHVSQCMQSANC